MLLHQLIINALSVELPSLDTTDGCTAQLTAASRLCAAGALRHGTAPPPAGLVVSTAAR